MDRAYRYGQVRDVFVYRLLGAGALEGELKTCRVLHVQAPVNLDEPQQWARINLCATNI